MVQTAEGALDVVGKILQRALTLTTERENGSLTSNQISSINDEITSLLMEVSQVKARTKFQGGGSSLFGSSATFTTGDGSTTTISISDLTTVSLFTVSSASIFAATDDTSAEIKAVVAGNTFTSSRVMSAVQTNIAERSALGTWQNRLNYIVDNMQTLSNNLADAQSRIVDTDYASETANLTRGQILQQAATSMLAQANQMPNVILTLLK
jgi:flagellin